MNLMIALFFAAAIAVTPPAPPPDLKTPPADAQRTADGLITKQLAAGTSSDHPAESDYIHFRYAVWKASDGAVIDFTRAGVAFVQISKLLPGMRTMFESMTPGEKRRGWIPSNLGGGKIDDGDMYVVDGELVDIVHPPAAPADVAAPPADAMTTPSGLAYRVLRPGTGTAHPKRHDTVVVHYSGWNTAGQMFDSSVPRDEPAEFSLGAVVPGWTEGLQLMTEGEKARFWIPEKLAYKGKAGMPSGMLVFDIELIKIK
jgi:peptidylprolyl isomerase